MVVILSTLLQSTQKQFDPYYALVLYVEYNKLEVSEFLLNLMLNLGNDAHLKSGPVFLSPSTFQCVIFRPPDNAWVSDFILVLTLASGEGKADAPPPTMSFFSEMATGQPVE